MDIYDRIHQIMVSKNITAATVCKNTGISSALMTQWKQRKQNPSGTKLQKVADYLGVSVDYLLRCDSNDTQNGKSSNEESDKKSAAVDIELTEFEIFNSLIQSKGLSAYRVAKDLGFSPVLFSDWKSGKSKPKYDKLQKIADYLGVSVDYLLGKGIPALPQYELTAHEKDVINAYRSMPDMQPAVDRLLGIV